MTIANQTEALRAVGLAIDNTRLAVRNALRAGVTPESIVEYGIPPQNQIADALLRRVVEEEVVVRAAQPELEVGKDEGPAAQPELEIDDTVVIEGER